MVRLKGGDPTIFARGAEETGALADRGIPFEVIGVFEEKGSGTGWSNPDEQAWIPLPTTGPYTVTVASLPVLLVYAFETSSKITLE